MFVEIFDIAAVKGPCHSIELACIAAFPARQLE